MPIGRAVKLETNMPEKTIETTWIGRVGVPEKYVKKALNKKEDLVVKKGREEMVIHYYEIEKRIVGFSQFFKDKFGREDYRLAYFMWAPPTEEEKLKELSKQVL